jgi:hypothetical protein
MEQVGQRPRGAVRLMQVEECDACSREGVVRMEAPAQMHSRRPRESPRYAGDRDGARDESRG